MMKLDQVQKAVEAYNLINRGYPANLSEVINKRYIGEEDILDPWGKKIDYNNSLKGVVIKSSGEDMVFGTSDDIVVGPLEYKK